MESPGFSRGEEVNAYGLSGSLALTGVVVIAMGGIVQLSALVGEWLALKHDQKGGPR